MFEILFHAMTIGAWSFMFCHPYQQKGEVFYFVRKWAMEVVDPGWRRRGQQMPSTTPEGKAWWRRLIWKWLTCEKCHGIVAGLIYYPLVLMTDYHLALQVFTIAVLGSFGAYVFSLKVR